MARRSRCVLLEVDPEHPEPHRLRQAVAYLKEGRVVGYPTDSLYALAADPWSRTAVDRLYRLRRLDPKKPLSLIMTELAKVSKYAILNDECFRFMRRVLPGPYTFILKATREAPRLSQDRRRTVGVRIPASPVALALADAFGAPLLSAGAHPLQDEPSDPRQVLAEHGHEIPMVLDAGLLMGDPSTVIDWTGDEPELIREGEGDVGDLFG